MTRAVRVNATFDEELLRRVDAFAGSRYEDRSTAIRQLVDFALREMHQREAVDAYSAGRVTLRELGRTLGLDLWATHDLLASQGVAVAQGTRDESRAGVRELLDSLGEGENPSRPSSG